ncbi:GDSL-type esterase/lipase family protein [Nocardia sp. NPDC057668]|uniref:GDSL-type esterase/lipase family protein n=1 Tax=Nocardia sp. NPDC057668 TaxID=3346202 RepID=UPI00366ADFC0
MNKDSRSARAGAGMLAALTFAGIVGTGPARAETGEGSCAGERWVGAWTASPSDAVGLIDPLLRPIASIGEQTYRVVVTPHRGGRQVRIKLTNRFRPLPLTVGRVTVAGQTAGAGVEAATLRPVTFGGRAGVTVEPGGELLSDPVEFASTAWESLAVSVYLPGPAPALSGHFNGNATSYYTAPGSGDSAADVTGAAYGLTTTSAPLVSAVEVTAGTAVSAVVALGDSITDGYVSADYLGVPQHSGILDADARYPDFLQRRIDAAGLPLVVLNAGISGNELVDDGIIPMFGPGLVSRLDSDVLAQTAVSDVIVLAGINDLDSPLGTDYDGLVAGYTALIARLHAAGLRVHLGTLTPAGDSLIGDTLAPRQNPIRLRVNDWIRAQRLSDSVIDFAAALQDPADPDRLDPRYAGPDLLHPNPAGYHAMAEVVDLSALGGNGCDTE